MQTVLLSGSPLEHRDMSGNVCESISVCGVSLCIVLDYFVCAFLRTYEIYVNVQGSISATLRYLPHTEDGVLTDKLRRFLTKHQSRAKVTAASL